MRYKAGYKYQIVLGDYEINTDIIPDEPIKTPYICLGNRGHLFIRSGYAWDGASGPAIDTKNFMRGSLVHDALYQLMRMGKLDARAWRNHADRLLRSLCRQDGMSAIRAWWVYKAVDIFGKSAASSKNKKIIKTAP